MIKIFWLTIILLNVIIFSSSVVFSSAKDPAPLIQYSNEFKDPTFLNKSILDRISKND